ncbi:hypothetical protein ACF09C_11960 [Streptomyces sp. NPDC014870]|uniref:hypothetical protein n=1 Tax=Streptomyces sp. NPDC014870 TaxID=3364925 RepID=UPI0036FFDA6D
MTFHQAGDLEAQSADIRSAALRGFGAIRAGDVTRALATGLRRRPAEETVADTWAAWQQGVAEGELRAV